MGSTFSCLRYHIIFSTKHRKPALADGAVRSRVHDYLRGTIRGLEAHCLAVGGTADHVHVLVGLKPSHSVADFVRELKKASTVWIRRTLNMAEFRWQEGYAAFSVSPGRCEPVVYYIARQEEHHRKRTLEEEMIELLSRAGIKLEEPLTF